ncbi:MAG: PAS domain S-box protein [Chloroflexaceae bacterium]|nr:PAS domain S-box protein [Chloroflexaceae bacterium]
MNGLFLMDTTGTVPGELDDIRQRLRIVRNRQDALYVAFFEKSSAIKLLIDPKSSKIVDANPAACAFYGYSLTLLRSMSILDINMLPAEQVQREMHLAAAEQRGSFRFRHRIASGDIRDVEVFSGPIDLWDHTLLFSIVHDVTAQQGAEMALRKAHHDLEGHVRQRTSELTQVNEQLQQAIDSRAQIELALRASEERYRMISELISDCAYAFRIEPDGQFICEWMTTPYTHSCNGNGASPSSNTAYGWIGPVHHDDTNVLQQRLQLLLSGQPAISELRLLTDHGDVRWLRDYARPIWDEHKERVVRLYGAAQDITARKHAEESLKQNQALLQGFLDHSPAMMLVRDLNGRIIMVNRRVCEHWSLASDELVGKTSENLFDPETAHRLTTHDQMVLAQNAPIEAEFVMNHRRHAHAYRRTAFPIADDAGNVYATGSITTDITHQQQMEEAHQALVDHSLQGLTIVQDCRIAFVNTAQAEIMGYPIAALIAMTSTEAAGLVHADDRPMLWQALQTMLSGPLVSHHGEYRIIRQDGVIRTLKITATLTRYQQKQALQIAAIDVTEQKDLAAAFERLQHQYELILQSAGEGILVSIPMV